MLDLYLDLMENGSVTNRIIVKLSGSFGAKVLWNGKPWEKVDISPFNCEEGRSYKVRRLRVKTVV